LSIKKERIEINFCKQFLLNNGFNECDNYFELKKLKLKIRVQYDEIIVDNLCNQNYTLPLNRYALIGFLFHFHILNIDYKYPNEIKNSI